jgi:pimeloyl-ACP methyl ester carboxylesterase
MPFLTTRAGKVHYTDQGAGHPVVLLHATLHNSQDFDAIAPKLAEHHRVIAIDWPSHGKSDPSAQPLTAPLLADVLEDIVNELDLPPASFIGNSVGGFAAARLAITQPARVTALVLVNTGGFIPWTPAARAFTRLIGTRPVARLLMPSLVNRYMRPQSDFDKKITKRVVATARTSSGARTAASIWRSFPTPGHDLRPQAANLTAPTLLVWGTQDPVIPLEAGQETSRLIPNSTLKTLETGHVVFASAPQEFLNLVEPFIKGKVTFDP